MDQERYKRLRLKSLEKQKVISNVKISIRKRGKSKMYELSPYERQMIQIVIILTWLIRQYCSKHFMT